MKIRKHVLIIYKIVLSALSIFLIYYFRESKSDEIDLSIKIMVSSIAVFGMLVKLILGYIFPENESSKAIQNFIETELLQHTQKGGVVKDVMRF